MAVSHHMRPGLTDKMRAKIMTVDPATRRVEGAIKDGSMIQIAVWEPGSAFRWPRENEIWIVRRDNGIWMLDRRTQDANDLLSVSDMAPGEMKLDSAVIYDSNGHRLATSTTGRPHLTFSASLAIYHAHTQSSTYLVHL